MADDADAQGVEVTEAEISAAQAAYYENYGRRFDQRREAMRAALRAASAARQPDARIAAIEAERDAAEARAREAVEVLRSLEWSAEGRDEHNDVQSVCSWCGWPESGGSHAPGCRLAAGLSSQPRTVDTSAPRQDASLAATPSSDGGPSR